jgi:hypothetical protein
MRVPLISLDKKWRLFMGIILTGLAIYIVVGFIINILAGEKIVK